MSAFMINNDTLDLLASMPAYTSGTVYVPQHRVLQAVAITDSVQWWRTRDMNSLTTADGQMIKSELIATNEIPVMLRYPEKKNEYSYEPFRYIDPYSVDVSDLIGACMCYRYQIAGSTTYWANVYIETILTEILCKISGDKWEYSRNKPPQRVLA